jgi:YesN/AraC family two-component response regulator
MNELGTQYDARLANQRVLMSNSKRIRVLCVDDHPLVRDGISFAIQKQSDMELVAEAGNGAEALTASREYQPDVVLMDIRMPELNGIEAT